MRSDQQIAEYLQSVAASQVLGKSERRLNLLEYIIRKELNGEGESLKAYSIGIDVLNRPDDFDPALDSSVRVEMGRLRTALASFESSANATCEIAVEIPVGSYRPNVHARSTATARNAEKVTAFPSSGRLTAAFMSLAVVACLSLMALYLWPREEEVGGLNESGVRVAMASFDGPQSATSRVETALRQSLARNRSIAIFTQGLPGIGIADFSLRGLVSDLNETEQRISIELLNVHTNRIVWTKSLSVSEQEDFDAQVSEVIGNELVLRLLGASKEVLEGRDPLTLNDEQLFLMATWVPGPTAANSFEWEQRRIELMRLALDRNPDLGTSHSVMADKLAQMANFYPSFDTEDVRNQVAMHIGRAKDLAPLHPDVMFNIAQSYWHSGRMQQSHAAMQRVIDLDPGHDLARFLSKVIPYTCAVPPNGLVAEATAFDQSLAPDNPIRWITLTWVAWLKLNNGDIAGALEAKQSAALIFETPYTFVGHAMLLHKVGRTDEAAQILRRQQLNWPGISADHFANVTMPRLCHEGDPPVGLIRGYEALAVAVPYQR